MGKRGLEIPRFWGPSRLTFCKEEDASQHILKHCWTVEHQSSCFPAPQVPEAFSFLVKEDTVAQQDAGQVTHEAAKSFVPAKDESTATSEEDMVSTMLDVRYDVSVAAAEGGRNGGRGMRGIYMREAHETAKPSSFSCSVTPRLHEVGACQAQAALSLLLLLDPDFTNLFRRTASSTSSVTSVLHKLEFAILLRFSLVNIRVGPDVCMACTPTE